MTDVTRVKETRMSIKDQILARIDPDEVIQLAKDLVKIPSFTTEETECARFLHDLFRKGGFESELQEVDPGRFQTVARLRGTGGGKSLMLNGHIDIDTMGAGWRRDPFTATIEGDRIYGAGIFNMKGGVTSMVMAAIAARRSGVKLRGDVVVACVAGELQGGVGTTHLLETGLRTDYAIVPEPYDTKNIITKHTGVMQILVHVIGRSAHISRKEQGINAIVKMAKAVEAIENATLRHTHDPDLPGLPRHQVGTIIGGRGYTPGGSTARGVETRGANIVPDVCTIWIDVRYNQSMDPEGILADIRDVLDREKKRDKDFGYEIEYPPVPERKANRVVMPPMSVPVTAHIVQTLKKNVTTILGEEPTVGAVAPFSYAGNDTAHLYNAGIECCLYGPVAGYTTEFPDRWTSVKQMQDCAKALGATIADICA